MMLDFQPLTQSDSTTDEEEEPIPTPVVTVVESDNHYGKFLIEPIQQGSGITIGNPLRRVLYSSLPGTAKMRLNLAPGLDLLGSNRSESVAY